MLGPVLDAGRSEGEILPILDNSVGAGALLAFADPEKHLLAGIDVDAESLDALSEDAKAAGFVRDFSSVGMENCSPRGFAAAVINHLSRFIWNRRTWYPVSRRLTGASVRIPAPSRTPTRFSRHWTPRRS